MLILNNLYYSRKIVFFFHSISVCKKVKRVKKDIKVINHLTKYKEKQKIVLRTMTNCFTELQ